MAEPLARVATPGSEAAWLAVAADRTVREVRALVQAALASDAEGNGERSAVEAVDDELRDDASDDASNQLRSLTLTLDREDAWLLEATRSLLDALGARGASAQVEALLAEGQETLLRLFPLGETDREGAGEVDGAQRRWVRERARWRDEAEALCESRIARNGDGHLRQVAAGTAYDEVALQAAAGRSTVGSMSPAALDAAVRQLCRALAGHELELSRQLLRFHRADGFRRLGYASEAQDARERLGLSRSSLLARRALSLRLEALPELSSALGRGELGVEAAVQVARVATPCTEAAWLERARRRTVKHLREEVAAAQTAVRLSGQRDCPPPTDNEIDGFHELERAVLAGAGARGDVALGSEASGSVTAPGSEASGSVTAPGAEQDGAAQSARRPWRVMLDSLGQWLARGLPAVASGSVAASGPDGDLPGRVQMSAGRAARAMGRVVLRLRVDAHLYDWWRHLEARARRWLPAP
jgi:hypothetical protein